MKPVRITYDPEGDILYITFGQPTAATGYQLSDQILLRVDPQSQQAAGLTMRNFSVHVHATHEIPLPRLEEDPAVTPSLVTIVSSPPVTRFLRAVEGKQGMCAILLSPSLHEALIG